MSESARTIVFFPEGAFGPTNNCIGIDDVLRRRGHRAVFIIEESFAGTLEAQGFEERLMRLTPGGRSSTSASDRSAPPTSSWPTTWPAPSPSPRPRSSPRSTS